MGKGEKQKVLNQLLDRQINFRLKRKDGFFMFMDPTSRSL